jgi:hypothetical protein
MALGTRTAVFHVKKEIRIKVIKLSFSFKRIIVPPRSGPGVIYEMFSDFDLGIAFAA